MKTLKPKTDKKWIYRDNAEKCRRFGLLHQYMYWIGRSNEVELDATELINRLCAKREKNG
jgi:hypothetical protein